MAFGDPEKYAKLCPYFNEAGEYWRGAYDVASFTPGHLHPDNTPPPPIHKSLLAPAWAA